jgi:nucleotide-binding universal stress UspA family protein
MELQTVSTRCDTSELQLKKILVPVDFSPLSQKAFRYALRLSLQFKTELTLMHVLEPMVPATFEGLSMSPPDSNEESLEPKNDMKTLVESARGCGITKIRSTFCRGLASHEIVEAAKELDVDLIVIATHGHTGWKHFCIGSTAERVVREKEHAFI